MNSCGCVDLHAPRRIVLTGGPGAGKTAVLELIQHYFCPHVKVLPESAGIIFGGGFPRGKAVEIRQATQRAIFYVQRELEKTADFVNLSIVVCDRGTVDGVAYWPGEMEEFWNSLDTELDVQLKRYYAVIHLRTPTAAAGYNNNNPLRLETAEEAAAIDGRIALAWERHPRRFVVQASTDFLTKATKVLEILRAEMPDCCKLGVSQLLENRLSSTVLQP